jgi:CheY-like chemotaxis protein
MSSIPVPTSSSNFRVRVRTAVITSADSNFRQRLSEILTGLRWQVREAAGGAQAWAEVQSAAPEAVIVDSWLPDLDLTEFLSDFRGSFPQVDVIAAGGASLQESPRGPYRQELLYAIRRCQDTDTAVWNAAPAIEQPVANLESVGKDSNHIAPWPIPNRDDSTAFAKDVPQSSQRLDEDRSLATPEHRDGLPVHPEKRPAGQDPAVCDRLPELVGNAPCMLEVSRRIRLVAPRLTPVLIGRGAASSVDAKQKAIRRD